MTDTPPDVTGNPLLRGLFGVLQAGAQEHLNTADIWSNLRANAASWQFQAQGLPQPYDPAALQSAGREILRAQGIDAAAVSSFRGVAGQWLQAKNSLASRDPGAQIRASDIFVPPWAQTAGSESPSRYRIRTQWQVQPAVGDVFTRWQSDELEGPLTSVDDVLAQTQATADGPKYRQLLADGGSQAISDYSLEMI